MAARTFVTLGSSSNVARYFFLIQGIDQIDAADEFGSFNGYHKIKKTAKSRMKKPM